MRILRSIVVPSATLVAFCDPKITGCSSIRAQVIRDELVWDKAIFLQQLAHQFERRALVASGLDENVGLPRPEWWIKLGDGFCRWMAMVRAAMVNSTRM